MVDRLARQSASIAYLQLPSRSISSSVSLSHAVGGRSDQWAISRLSHPLLNGTKRRLMIADQGANHPRTAVILLCIRVNAFPFKTWIFSIGRCSCILRTS